MTISQFSFEGAVQDGGEEGVELGGGFGLEALEGIHLGLEGVQFGHDAALFANWRGGDARGEDVALIDFPDSRGRFGLFFDGSARG
jgi:hypothetical protein